MSSTPASALIAALIAPAATAETALPVSVDGTPVDTAFTRLFDAEAAAAQAIQNTVAATLPANTSAEVPLSAAPVAADSAMPEALMLVQLLLSNQAAQPLPTVENPDAHSVELEAPVETEMPVEVPSNVDTDLNSEIDTDLNTDRGTNLETVETLQSKTQSTHIIVEQPEIEAQDLSETPLASEPKPTTAGAEKSVVNPPNPQTMEKPQIVRSESTIEALPAQVAETKKAVAHTGTASTTVTPAPKSDLPVVVQPQTPKLNPAGPQRVEFVVSTAQPVKEAAPETEVAASTDVRLQAKPQVLARLTLDIPQSKDVSGEHALPVEESDERGLELERPSNDATFASQPALPEAFHLGAAGVLNAPKTAQAFVAPTPESVDESEQPLEAITPREDKREPKSAAKELTRAEHPAVVVQPETNSDADTQLDEIVPLPVPFARAILGKGKEADAVEESIRLVSDRGSAPVRSQQPAQTLVVREAAPKSAPIQLLAAAETTVESQRTIALASAQKFSASSPISTEIPHAEHDDKNVDSLPAKTLDRTATNLLIKGNVSGFASTRQTSLEGFSYSAPQDENTASAAPVPLLDGGRPETIATRNPADISESAQPARAEKLLRELTASIPNPYRVTTFEIKPEGMGPVRVKITTRGEGENAIWKVQIQTSDPAARSLLSEHMNELRERMPAAENVKVELAAPSASDARNESNRQDQGSNRERNEGRAHREETQRQSDRQSGRGRGGNFLEWLAERE